MPQPRPENVVEFLLIPQFSMMSVASAVEPLRSANRLLGYSAYQWTMVSVDGAAVEASNGMVVAPERKLSATSARPDFLFVCASLMTDPEDRALVHTTLHRRAADRTKIGALSGGTLILAAAGLLEDVRCTIHWEYKPALVERFPFIECTDSLYEIDKGRYTCAGGIASLDLFLYLIAEDHGHELAEAVGNQFQIDRIRAGDVAQRPGGMAQLEAAPAVLRSAIMLMIQNIEEPLSASDLAKRTGSSTRTLERVFVRYLNATPARYYKELRLERARELLIHTSLSIVDVAVMTGFSSSSYFAGCYKDHFGATPTFHRNRRVMKSLRWG